MTQDWNRTETTEVSICVEELHGKKHVFDGVAPSDSAETLMSKIERKTKVPKHEFVLFCNGRIVEEKQTLKDYDIYTSSILLLRQKRKGKETSVSCDLRQIVWNKFDHYYKKIQNLVNKFPQFFEDTTRMLSEKDFSRISKAIGDGWQSLGMELGLDKIKLEHITANNQTLEMKIVDMLTQWSRQKPSEAKAGNLYSAIKNCTDLSCNLETLKSIVLGV
ncbi:uncharacterized protein LOC123538314 [Mercenaria mercenaria]|uniref:uncharacterized protein LOC123538314 n=1 Tax=Mercenaria mercenaria TaxID=6596 RepID=UPI00234FA574|nr:uncharacterized protein LOC123538314 [Mercenaria mercenaria]